LPISVASAAAMSSSTASGPVGSGIVPGRRQRVSNQAAKFAEGCPDAVRTGLAALDEASLKKTFYSADSRPPFWRQRPRGGD
jgi:hypothetical protein